jgi:prophage regulatory protein
MDITSTHRILRLPAVIAITGLSRSTIYALSAQNQFPHCINLSNARAVGWIEQEVLDWIQRRIDETRKKKP